MVNVNERISIDLNNLPKHIAIIMDGNGRWAKKRGLPRAAGHKAGIDTVRKIIKYSSKIGIKYLTLYTFSTENWKRPISEVDALMKLFLFYLKKEIPELDKNNVKLNFIGELSAFNEEILNAIKSADERLCSNTGLVVNLAVNYGGRGDIIQAVKRIAKEDRLGKIDADKLNMDEFKNYLYTSDIPDPDLLIRPGGEYRISNFLLWQIAYSELWFSDVLWPDFSEDDLDKAIYDYQHRQRRFGGL